MISSRNAAVARVSGSELAAAPWYVGRHWMADEQSGPLFLNESKQWSIQSGVQQKKTSENKREKKGKRKKENGDDDGDDDSDDKVAAAWRRRRWRSFPQTHHAYA